jgi:6-phosphofructokinase 1
MIRLSPDDFDDPHELAKYAATAGISLEEFRQQFHYLVETAPNAKRRERNGEIELQHESSQLGPPERASEKKPSLVKT